MCSSVSSATESNLHDPTFCRAFGRIVKYSFLVEAKEDFLNHIFGFITVVQDAESNSKHQPGIPTKEQVESFCILSLEASHEFFIAGGPGLDGLGRGDRIFLACPPYHGECQRAPIQRRTHC